MRPRKPEKPLEIDREMEEKQLQEGARVFCNILHKFGLKYSVDRVKIDEDWGPHISISGGEYIIKLEPKGIELDTIRGKQVKQMLRWVTYRAWFDYGSRESPPDGGIDPIHDEASILGAVRWTFIDIIHREIDGFLEDLPNGG